MMMKRTRIDMNKLRRLLVHIFHHLISYTRTMDHDFCMVIDDDDYAIALHLQQMNDNNCCVVVDDDHALALHLQQMELAQHNERRGNVTTSSPSGYRSKGVCGSSRYRKQNELLRELHNVRVNRLHGSR